MKTDSVKIEPYGPDWKFWLVLGFGLICNLAPLAGVKYLPFVDLPGHMAFVGALVHRADPAAHINRFYTLDVRWIPSVLFEALGCIAYPHITIETFARLFVAVFAILGPPLAMVYALRVFGRDQRLALLVLPLLYHRCLWFGFIDYCAALTSLILSLALLVSILRFFSWRCFLALVLTSVATVAAHAFVALVLFGLAVVVFLANGVGALRRRGPLSSAMLRSSMAALAMVPAGVYLGSWLWTGVTEGAGRTSLLTEVLQTRHSLIDSAGLFYEWSLGSLAGWTSAAPIIALAANLVLVGVWVAMNRARNDSSPGKYHGPLLLLVTALVFVVLPMRIYSPFHWWAVSVRLVVPIWLFLILALPAARTRMPIWLFLPALAATVLQGVVLTRDFALFNRGDMAHYDQAIDAIPPGLRLLGLWGVPPELGRYRDPVLRHVASYYIVRHGGMVRPSLFGNTGRAWVDEKLPFPAPWDGILENFNWAEHGASVDYLLLRDPVEGLDDRPGELALAPPGKLNLVGRFGTWRVWASWRGGAFQPSREQVAPAGS